MRRHAAVVTRSVIALCFVSIYVQYDIDIMFLCCRKRMCVCVRLKGRDLTFKGTVRHHDGGSVVTRFVLCFVCVCVCLRERERER